MSVTSQTITLARPPVPVISLRIFSSSLCVLLRRSTSAPACARARDAAAPRPRPAPVTSATRPSRRKDSVMTSGVAPHAEVGLFLVSPESLDSAQARAVVTDQHTRLFRAFLIRHRLQELPHPQAAG